MEWINYHHLLYFWVVAREGGLVAAGKVLRLSHPTLSAQVHALEDQLGEKLFIKVGRKLTLTDVGRVVFRYADEIFALGREMLDTVKGRSSGQPLRLDVGIADVVPKLVVRRLLQPALSLPDPVRLVCREDSYEKLLADLALHALDVVISDAPVPTGSNIRAFNHLLGETGVSFFGTRSLVNAHKRKFPASLHDAPMLLPLEQLTPEAFAQQLVRPQRHQAPGHRGVRGQRPAHGVWRRWARHLRRAQRGRGRSDGPVRRAAARARGRSARALLRHLCRAPPEESGNGRHLGRRAPGAVRAKAAQLATGASRQSQSFGVSWTLRCCAWSLGSGAWSSTQLEC
jgi:LysR family transcriptional regulator, transcriptional activator of nhaA